MRLSRAATGGKEQNTYTGEKKTNRAVQVWMGEDKSCLGPDPGEIPNSSTKKAGLWDALPYHRRKKLSPRLVGKKASSGPFHPLIAERDRSPPGPQKRAQTRHRGLRKKGKVWKKK